GGDAAIRRCLKQKAPDHLRHAKQRRKGDPYGALPHIGTGQNLAVDVRGTLFITPRVIECLALKALAAALVALDADHRDAAGCVPHLDAVEQAWRATAGTRSMIASFGMAPVPCCPGLPTRSR